MEDTPSLSQSSIGADFLGAEKLEDSMGLCLSGGGYRAMLYHCGSLVRLNELGLMVELAEVASVSGGSIIAGKLALAWRKLTFVDGVATNLDKEVIEPIVRFASVGVDVKAILLGLLPGLSAADIVARSYDKHLFNGSTLADIPKDSPRFTFMATNLQTGSGWRFSGDYAVDHRVGEIRNPKLPLAKVVTASSAFPPFLSPVTIEFGENEVVALPGADLHQPPYTTRAVLTDGGVYDNLGLERVWKRCRTILVSNAGKNVPEIGSPSGRWIGQILRTLNLVQQQAESSRKRILFGMSNQQEREVAFWSIETPIANYGSGNPLNLTEHHSHEAANIRTRLNAFNAAEIYLLLRCGYAAADASLNARGLLGNGSKANVDACSKYC